MPQDIQPSPVKDFYSRSTMAIPLPRLSSYAQPTSQATSSPSFPSISSAGQGSSKRPKLTLKTSSLPISTGKSNTSIRLETVGVASTPTARNTFHNAFGAAASQSQSSCQPKPLRTCSSDSIVSSSSNCSANSVTSAESNASSATSTDSMTPPVPYRLSYDSKSILTNGPLPKVRRPPSLTSSRPMFSNAKRVSFRAPLSETITTVKYTTAHMDLETTDSRSGRGLPPPTLVLRGQRIALQAAGDAKDISASPAQQGEDVDSECRSNSPPVDGDRDEEDSDVCPSAPVKRRREWVWTLGPLKREADADRLAIEGQQS